LEASKPQFLDDCVFLSYAGWGVEKLMKHAESVASNLEAANIIIFNNSSCRFPFGYFEQSENEVQS
jgi:hypothetical protein